MARTISDEELLLKRRARRRLIGAIVLVVAIVVVLPMVLDTEPRPGGQTVSVQIPSSDSGVFTSKVVPISPAPESKAGPGPRPAAPAAEGAKEITAASPAPPPVLVKETVQETPNEAVKKAPKSAAAKPQAKPAARPDGKYVVQVIALADAAKAKQMQVKIADAGIKSYTEVVKTSKGDVTRVRAGPFATRGAAEKAREQLKILGMNGNIITR